MSVKLECIHPDDSTQTVYDVNIKDGIQLTHTINNDTDLQVGQVTSACLKFKTDLNTFQLGTKITYYDENIYTAGTYVKKGTFTVDTIEKENEFYTITAYDDICNFDIKIDSWISGKNNITLVSLFQQLCTKCGVGYSTDEFLNQSFKFQTLKNVSGLTGRGLLQYISAIAGGFIRIHTDDDSNYGKAEIAYYKQNNNFTSVNPITSSDYVNLTIADFNTPQITAVRCQASNGSCVRPAGNTSQELNLGYNPILNLRTASAIQGPVDTIYNKLASYGSYKPCIFEMYADPGINCGDIIYIKYAKDGLLQTSKVLIMTKEVQGGSVKFSGTGNSDRQPTVTTNDDKINSLLTSNLLTDNNYISYNFFTDNTTKVFNSNIQCNDILINGLGYPGNTSNKSLLAVIQYLLQASAQPATYDITLDQANWGRGYTGYITSYPPQAGRNVETTGCVDYNTAGGFITLFCDNPDYRTAPTGGTVVIKDNGNTKATYNVTCYTATGPRGTGYEMAYPGNITYEDTYYRVWINGTLVVGSAGQPWDRDFTDPEKVIVELLEADGFISFIPVLPGEYIVKFYDPIEYNELYVYKMKFD